jgi:hypothetical protein
MDCPHCAKDVGDVVPRKRITDESDKREAAEKELKDLRTKTAEQDSQIKLLEKDAKRAKDADAELGTMREDRELEKLAGKWEMDADAAAEFRRRWRELPNTKDSPRPKYEDYMKGLAKEPDNVPGFLRDHLPTFDDEGAVVPKQPAKGAQMRDVVNTDKGTSREGNRTKGKGNITGEEHKALVARANAGDKKALMQIAQLRGQVANQMGMTIDPLPASNPFATAKDTGSGGDS